MSKFKHIFLGGLLSLVVSPLFGLSSAHNYVATNAWSGPQTSTAGTYYASVGSETGTSLVSKLKTVTSGAQVSYDWSRYEAADEAEGVSNSVLQIYARTNILKTKHVSGSTGWNREHTYPQSKIGSPATSDNHHIFADDNKTNGIRDNKLFGEVAMSSSNQVVDSTGRKTDNYTTSTYFMPNPEARGEVARATMYLHVRYGYSVTGNFQSVALMLKWHIEHPVTNREIYRNNIVHSLQKNRNPFIDHEEYACRIWGSTNSQTQSLCASQPVVDVTGVEVTPDNATIDLTTDTKTLQLNANVLPSNASTKTVNWTSSNPDIATVTNTGFVTALSVGEVTITATSTADGTKKGSALIKVIGAEEPVSEDPTSENPGSNIPTSEIPTSENPADGDKTPIQPVVLISVIAGAVLVAGGTTLIIFLAKRKRK